MELKMTKQRKDFRSNKAVRLQQDCTPEERIPERGVLNLIEYHSKQLERLQERLRRRRCKFFTG